MEIKEILNYFKYSEAGFPTEAVNAALDQQEAITPYLLSILEHTLANYKSIVPYQLDYFFALYLLSKFREKKALPLILAIASLPEDWPEILLGDDITESLARFIVSTFDHDLSPIKKVIEDPTLNDWSRNAALNSLLGLVAVQKIKREEIIEYFRSLFHSSLAEDEFFISQLAGVAARLYPEELLEEINDAFNKDKIDPWVINEKFIENVLAKGKENCLQKYVYKYHFHLPIDDIAKEMNWINHLNKDGFAEEEDEEDSILECDHKDCDHNHYFTPDAAVPYVRPSAKIGRNDPCACGSGKKYKKCCLTT